MFKHACQVMHMNCCIIHPCIKLQIAAQSIHWLTDNSTLNQQSADSA